jgi:hypothetical protein
MVRLIIHKSREKSYHCRRMGDYAATREAARAASIARCPRYVRLRSKGGAKADMEPLRSRAINRHMHRSK